MQPPSAAVLLISLAPIDFVASYSSGVLYPLPQRLICHPPTCHLSTLVSMLASLQRHISLSLFTRKATRRCVFFLQPDHLISNRSFSAKVLSFCHNVIIKIPLSFPSLHLYFTLFLVLCSFPCIFYPLVHFYVLPNEVE